MVVIPPTKDTDAEDVVWGLQTAEALWKRGERIDAIVWLRRAAQAAGEAADDDRALELARAAAELSDWMATEPAVGTEPPPALGTLGSPTAMPPGAPPPADKPYDPSAVSTFVPYGDDERPASLAPAASTEGTLTYRPEPPMSRPPSSPNFHASAPVFPPPNAMPVADQRPTAMAPPGPSFDASNGDDDGTESGGTTSVPPAEHVHAGMFNPWEDGALPAPPANAPPPAVAPQFATEEEEVVTSIRPQQLAEQRAEAVSEVRVPVLAPPRPAAPSPPGRPPPLPPRARKPPVPGAPPLPPSAPRTPAAPVAVAPSAPTPVPPSPTQVMDQPEPQVPEPTRTEPLPIDVDDSSVPELPRAAAAAPAKELPKLDLESVEAFADLPDDARAAFAAAAKVSALAEGEEVNGFALAYILEGTVDVAATMVDAPAARLEAGAVLRSRGTTDEGVPMRLIGVGTGIVATWTDAEVQDAFRTIPWVEEDLRTAADRMQTFVGVTIGPLGERLDASIREQIINRLTMKTLLPGDIVVTQGEPMVGLILIGVGELELIDGDKVAGVVGSGEFLFASEVLGGGDVPRTARAGPGGALILYGDRHIAQELLVTCPPLLEVFAGM